MGGGRWEVVAQQMTNCFSDAELEPHQLPDLLDVVKNFSSPKCRLPAWIRQLESARPSLCSASGSQGQLHAAGGMAMDTRGKVTHLCPLHLSQKLPAAGVTV